MASIQEAIESVLNQTYENIEYIVIDGGSTDGTLDIIRNYENKIYKFISEPDNGIYDAMNKGISFATGDIIGILNSDDFYIDNDVIEIIVNQFQEKLVDSVYADLVYVRPDDLNKVVRYYDSGKCVPENYKFALYPAHPTFFVKKAIYDQYGLFKTDYKIAADFDIIARFLYCNKITYSYLNKPIIKMRTGGVSTSISSIWRNSKEQLRVCRENSIKTNMFYIFSKYFTKAMGLVKRL